MLRFSKNLLFPSLKFIKAVNFKNQPESQVRIYKLDWITTDNVKEERWADNLNDSPPPIPFPGTLPEELRYTIDNQLYAIPEGFLQEIRLCSTKATEEWSRQTPLFRPNFPTTVNPAISFVLNAFNVLADCLYDSDTKYFSRSNIKYILPHILAYRFWSFQIKADMVIRNAGLKEFTFELEDLQKKDPEIHKDLVHYFKLLNAHYEKIIKLRLRENVRVIEDATLEDFITNKRSSSILEELTLDIPEIGPVILTKVRLTRSGAVYLSGEVLNTERVLKAYNKGDSPTKFTTTLKNVGDNYHLALLGCGIESISSTPPVILKIKINHISKVIHPRHSSLENEDDTVIPKKQTIDFRTDAF